MVVDNISGTTSNSFSIGNLGRSNVSIIANAISGATPTLRWNARESKWEFSPDGITFTEFGASTGGSSDWTPLTAGVDFSPTLPESTSQIAMLVDHTETIYPGVPIRILDLYGVEYGDTSAQLSNYYKITGITSSILDSGGKLYFSIARDGDCRIIIYNRAAKTDPIAMTDWFDSSFSGDVDLMAVGSSGIGGQITVANMTDPISAIYVEFYKWLFVATCTDSRLTFFGPPLNAFNSYISEMWVGATARTQHIQFFVPGNYALTATNTLLADFLFMPKGYFWFGGRARVIGFRVMANEVSNVTKAKVNLYVNDQVLCTSNSRTGLEITAAKHGYYTSTDIDSTKTALSIASSIDITTTQGDIVGTYDSDLSVTVVIVWE